MAEILDGAAIEVALASLPGWSYDGSALVRQVSVPADSQDGLLEAVGQAADAVDHHPVVDRSGEALTFRLWTHSAGGVTAKDIDLAARIDRALSGAGTDEGTA
jgi:4a-hydroxytetrahydrobiopterin dehydratase